MTTATDELMRIERAGWDALSTSGEAATKHYDDVLSDDVLMVFPGGMVIDDRAQVVASMKEGGSWSRYELSDERVLPLDDDTAILTYRANATREGKDYEALFNSTYVRKDGDWKLALHQQTPV